MDTKKQMKPIAANLGEFVSSEASAPSMALEEQEADLLVSIVEGISHPQDYRLAAGEVLARRGDPRISVFDPTMINIPAACIRIGLHEDDMETVFQECRSFGVMRDLVELEGPEHLVELSPFRIAKYCVTNVEFLEFKNDTGFQFTPSSWINKTFDKTKSNHPVFSVSFAAARQYCEWLSEKTKRFFRLPTEAEWEYASSGCEHLKYPWGDHFEDGCANTIEERMFSTTPIGMYAKGDSPFGVRDMAGNVEEYTTNTYKNYLGHAIPDESFAKSLEGQQIVRGGSFARFQDLTRTTSRHAVSQHDKFVIGFRLVEDLPLH